MANEQPNRAARRRVSRAQKPAKAKPVKPGERVPIAEPQPEGVSFSTLELSLSVLESTQLKVDGDEFEVLAIRMIQAKQELKAAIKRLGGGAEAEVQSS